MGEEPLDCFGFYLYCRPFLRGKTESSIDNIRKVTLPWQTGMVCRNALCSSGGMVDASGSNPDIRKDVRVQVSPGVPLMRIFMTAI